jgi:methylated-DNA-[protein]-cysteine S-methyltransferase
MTTPPESDATNLPDLLAALSDNEGQTLVRLHARLVTAAAAQGVLDIGYRTVDTPVGTLLLAATEQGLLRVAYPSQDHDAVLAALGRTVSPRILHAPARLDEVSRQLEQYFAGRRTGFELPLDLRLSTGFRRTVLAHLSHIDYGRTESYAQVATAAGSPKAVRAVGSACATNPLPVVLPCHRVVRSDGSWGQYVGGAEAKQALLRLEHAD